MSNCWWATDQLCICKCPCECKLVIVVQCFFFVVFLVVQVSGCTAYLQLYSSEALPTWGFLCLGLISLKCNAKYNAAKDYELTASTVTVKLCSYTPASHHLFTVSVSSVRNAEVPFVVMQCVWITLRLDFTVGVPAYKPRRLFSTSCKNQCACATDLNHFVY